MSSTQSSQAVAKMRTIIIAAVKTEVENTKPAAVTGLASTAESSAQEIASSSSGGTNMPPSALRPNKTRRYPGTSEDRASAGNSKGEEALPDTAAAVTIAGNRISGLSDAEYSAASHPSRRSSGTGSDPSSRRASVSSNQSARRGSGLFARMQSSSNEGSLPSLQSSRRNSDVDDTRSRRSSTSRVSRRSSALLSWGK